MGIQNYFCSYRLSDGTKVKVHLYDTAGQEKYNAISEQYYKITDCCLLVYSIADKSSFLECKNYFNDCIKEKCKQNTKVVVLGNKTDLEDQREVSSEEGAGFALENNYIFMEASCLKNDNVANAFETLIETTNIESKKNPINLKNNKNKKKKCSC